MRPAIFCMGMKLVAGQREWLSAKYNPLSVCAAPALCSTTFCRDIQMRTVRGLYQLKLVAEYSLLTSVPLTIAKDKLTGYSSHTMLTEEHSKIRKSIESGLQVGRTKGERAHNWSGGLHTATAPCAVFKLSLI